MKRKCLKCPNEFESTGPGNRICPKCSKSKSASPATVKTSRMREFKLRIRERFGKESWHDPFSKKGKENKKRGPL